MLETSYSISPSVTYGRSVVGSAFLAVPPSTQGIAMVKHVWTSNAYVHMKKQFWAHFCGAPLTGSICKARILAPMKRTDNMGAKFIAFEATIMAFSNFENLD